MLVTHSNYFFDQCITTFEGCYLESTANDFLSDFFHIITLHLKMGMNLF